MAPSEAAPAADLQASGVRVVAALPCICARVLGVPAAAASKAFFELQDEPRPTATLHGVDAMAPGLQSGTAAHCEQDYGALCPNMWVDVGRILGGERASLVDKPARDGCRTVWLLSGDAQYCVAGRRFAAMLCVRACPWRLCVTAMAGRALAKLATLATCQRRVHTCARVLAGAIMVAGVG